MNLEKAKALLKKVNIKVILVTYILIYTVSPFISQVTSRYLTTYFYMGVVVVTVVYTFVVCRLRDVKEYIFLLLPFIAFQVLQMIDSNEPNTLLLGYRILLFMLPICMGYCITRYAEVTSWYAIVVFAVFAVTLVTTTVGCVLNPNASRVLATTESSLDPTAIGYNMSNIGGYFFTYSCTLLYPLVVLGCKLKKLPLWLAIVCSAAVFLLAVNTSYTLSLMLVLVTSLLYIFPKRLTMKQFFLFSFLGLVLGVVFSGALAALMSDIGNMIGNPEMAQKMSAIFGGEEALNSLDDNRAELYMKSLQTFLRNPLLGCYFTGEGRPGGHSFVLDTLARFGLLGGTLLFLMYRAIYRAFYKPFVSQQGFGFAVWLFLQPIVLSVLNTGMWLENLCLFSPIVLCVFYSPSHCRPEPERPDTVFILSPRLASKRSGG